MKKTIYIAGPVSNVPQLNKPKFDEAAKFIRTLGHIAVNPLEICSHISPNDWQGCMNLCIPALMKCDLLLMLDDWHQSKGASVEVNLWRGLNRPYKTFFIFQHEHQNAQTIGEAKA